MRPMLASLLVVVAATCLACGLPRVPIKQTFDRRASIDANGRRVHVYEARDVRALDSTNRLLRVEYLPVSMFVAVDARDSVDFIATVAWMELLWRFSERLSPTDKSYYAPIPQSLIRSGDSATVTWGYPSIDTRDEDLKYTTPYRNSYWSVDIFEPGLERREIYQGDIRSYPQFAPYDALRRFVAGGTYDRAFADTANVYAALRRYFATRASADTGTLRE